MRPKDIPRRAGPRPPTFPVAQDFSPASGDTVGNRMTQPLAYLYPEFLESQEARPIRILAEYLEPLRRFKEQKIQDTVVFFGSARVDSRERAERALQSLRARGVENADDAYEPELTRSRRAVEGARHS